MLRRLAISCVLAALALSAGARTRPHYGGTARVEIEGDPWLRPSGLARRLVLDGLTRMDADGSVQPALAIDWKSENSDHRWQFHLRMGVHFSDGSAVTSVNVVAALSRACSDHCPWSAIYTVGSSVVFTSDSPMPNLPELLAGDDFLIALSIASNGSTPDGVIGTGPFKVTEFANSVLTLAANENSWQGRPFADAVEITVHRAIRDQWLDLSFGRTDLAEVPADQMRQAQQQRLTVIASPSATLLALTVADSGALANPLLRAAIAQAVDRAALSNVIFQKQGEVTASLLPNRLTGYAFLFPVERDVAKAQQLRGGLTPPPLTLAADSAAVMQLAAQRIALNLREAGFNVQVINASGVQHADLSLRRIALESNQPQAALESILRAVGETSRAPQQTTQSLYDVEREVLDRKTVVPLLYLPRAYAVGGRMRDLRLGPEGSPDFANASIEDVP